MRTVVSCKYSFGLGRTQNSDMRLFYVEARGRASDVHAATFHPRTRQVAPLHSFSTRWLTLTLAGALPLLDGTPIVEVWVAAVALATDALEGALG